MKKNFDYTYMMKYVDTFFVEGKSETHDIIAKSFSDYLQTLNKSEFIEKLIFTGYIPDIYNSDSSQETLFTKLVEVITAEWGRRMGFGSSYIKQKSSYPDVEIKINNKYIVCDSKSFRLGRSQAAPNVKDFLKLADITKWLDRYDKKNQLGGLVVYPCKHEWTNGSDAYQYCSNKKVPTLMLPYKYLAFLLEKADSFNTAKLEELWNYKKLFPKPLDNKKNNKNKYWSIVDKKICKIIKITEKELREYMEKADDLIKNYIVENVEELERYVKLIKEKKKEQLDLIKKEQLEEMLLNFMIKDECQKIEQSIININKFRIENIE